MPIRRTGINISFTTNVFKRKELPEELQSERGRAKHGVFGINEVDVGGEDFVVVFARTTNDPNVRG